MAIKQRVSTRKAERWQKATWTKKADLWAIRVNEALELTRIRVLFHWAKTLNENVTADEEAWYHKFFSKEHTWAIRANAEQK